MQSNKRYGLLGRSLGHSFSKNFFETLFEENGIAATFENVELTVLNKDSFHALTQLSGFSVTIPYKEEIIQFLDELSPEAEKIGAVNCVYQFEPGKFRGYNTDAFGFHQSIKPFLTNKHERAVIFGTGGASKAVKYVLENIGIDVIHVSRQAESERVFGYDEVNNHMLRACKLLVNTTPVGTFPEMDNMLPIPVEFLTDEHLVVDLIYNPAETKLLRLSKERGAMILNGETMLKQQALKSWSIWNGVQSTDAQEI